MATIKGKFIHGVIGGMVYRNYRGQQIVQSTPVIREKNRTAGTVNAARVFGKASKLAYVVRFGLEHICHKWYDSTMNYRLNAEILRCLTMAKNNETQAFNFSTEMFRSLAGFEFNINSPLKKHLFVQPVLHMEENRLLVDIPDLHVPGDIRLPEERIDCRLLMTTTMIDLTNGFVTLAEPQYMDIKGYFKTNHTPGKRFTFDLMPGCLCITGIALEFIEETFSGKHVINHKSFHPAAILHAQLTQGTPDHSTYDDDDRWWNLNFGFA